MVAEAEPKTNKPFQRFVQSVFILVFLLVVALTIFMVVRPLTLPDPVPLEQWLPNYQQIEEDIHTHRQSLDKETPKILELSIKQGDVKHVYIKIAYSNEDVSKDNKISFRDGITSQDMIAIFFNIQDIQRTINAAETPYSMEFFNVDDKETVAIFTFPPEGLVNCEWNDIKTRPFICASTIQLNADYWNDVPKNPWGLRAYYPTFSPPEISYLP